MHDRTAPSEAITAAVPCQACGGSGGRTESEWDGTTLRQSWRPCTACGGQGVRR